MPPMEGEAPIAPAEPASSGIISEFSFCRLGLNKARHKGYQYQ